MSDAPHTTRPPDSGHTARWFFVFQELLGTPELARFYTDLLINSPTTVTAARGRQEFSKSTAYKYANMLSSYSSSSAATPNSANMLAYL